MAAKAVTETVTTFFVVTVSDPSTGEELRFARPFVHAKGFESEPTYAVLSTVRGQRTALLATSVAECKRIMSTLRRTAKDAGVDPSSLVQVAVLSAKAYKNAAAAEAALTPKATIAKATTAKATTSAKKATTAKVETAAPVVLTTYTVRVAVGKGQWTAEKASAVPMLGAIVATKGRERKAMRWVKAEGKDVPGNVTYNIAWAKRVLGEGWRVEFVAVS